MRYNGKYGGIHSEGNTEETGEMGGGGDTEDTGEVQCFISVK